MVRVSRLLTICKSTNMQRIEVNTLGFDLTKEVSSDIAEYDRLAKKDGAGHESAVFNTIYRSTLPKFRTAFCKWLEKETDIGRKTKTEGEGEKAKTTYDEQESKYVNRVIATLGGDEDALRATWAAQAQVFMDAAAFDPSETERSPGEKLVAKTYQKWAADAIAAGKADKLAALLSSKLGIEVKSDVESLSKAIAQNEAKIREQRKAEYADV